jgi:phosphomannomutase
LLNELGVEVVHQYSETTGLFPHPPEPTRENLTGLCEAVRNQGADIGFAQDPDADRLAIVDERGVYIGEEYTLALATLHVLKKSRVSKQAVVVTNLSTSRMIDDIATRYGAQVVRTPVGEANVAAEMRLRDALIGGEGNGGVIWPKTVHVRDSLSGIAIILELLSQHNESLAEIVSSITPYSIVKDKFNASPVLIERITTTLQKHFKSQKIDLQDGARVDWPDKWVHVRPSNTEPIIRIIAEARTTEIADALISEVRSLLLS